MPKPAGWCFRALTSADGTTTLTLTKPTGTVDNDIVFLAITHKGAGFATFPGGFTVIAQVLINGTRVELAWKRASGEPASYNITGLADTAVGECLTYTGGLLAGDIVQAVVTSSGLANAARLASGTLTVPAPGSLILLVAGGSANTFIGSLGGQMGQDSLEDYSQWSLRTMLEGGTPNGSDCRLGVYEGYKVIAGNQPAMVTSTSSPYSADWATIMVSLAEEKTAGETAGTTYYLTKKVPGVRFEGVTQGQWRSSWGAAPTEWSRETFTFLLSQQKPGGGKLEDPVFTINQQANFDFLFARWVSPPLAGQTLDSTVDLVMAVGNYWQSDSLGHANQSVVVTKLHAYISKGQSPAVRQTIIRRNIQTSGWNFNAYQGLNLDNPLDIEGIIEPGDSLVFEIGARIVSSPTPIPNYPPTEYTRLLVSLGTAYDSGNNMNTDGVGVNTDALDGANGATQVPRLVFSQTLQELTTAQLDILQPVPTNIDAAHAIEITDTPYTSEVLNSTRVTSFDRSLWWTFVADRTGVAHATAFGSSVWSHMQWYTGTPTALVSKTALIFGSVLGFAHRARMALAHEVVEGTRYYIRLKTGITAGNFTTPPSSGGAVRLTLAYRRLPQLDDIYIGADRIFALDDCGNVINFGTDQLSEVPVGLQIDYSKAPIEDLSNNIHTGERILNGLLHTRLIEIFDLPTLGNQGPELDWVGTFDQLDPQGANDFNYNMASLLFYDDQQMLVGWFGNGFRHVDGVGSLPAYYDSPSSDPDNSSIRLVNVRHGDNQTGAPYPAGATFEPEAAMAPHHFALGPDGHTLYYVDGSWYLSSSQIGGVVTDLRCSTIKRFDLVTSHQLEDFATLELEPGPNAGLRNLFSIGEHGFLVCNGGRIDWVNMSGQTVMSYRARIADYPQSFSSVALTHDGRRFWAVDDNTADLFQFDLFGGFLVKHVKTYLIPAIETQIVLYQPNGLQLCWT